MAKRLTSWRCARCGWRFAAAVLLALLAARLPVSLATGLHDPTRPPQLQPAAKGRSAAHLPVLESVLLLPGYKAAIIDGQTVMLGSTFKGARLVNLTARTARLRRGGHMQMLRLAPAPEAETAGEGEVPAMPAAAMEKIN